MSWEDVHRNLSRIARQKSALEAEEATWIAAAAREKVHLHLGYGNLAEYLGRLFGHRPRLAADKIRVARALERLPAMKEALAAAELSFSALRELTRVAVPETEGLWIEAARGKTVREVEEMVSGRRPGDSPDAPPEPGARRTVLRLEISAEAYAAFQEARAKCVNEVGHGLEDDELVRMIAEKALAQGGGGEKGRSPYQVKLSVCPECGHSDRADGGALHPVEPARAAQARCDAQVLGADPKDPARATQTIPPKIRRHVLRRDGGCLVPGCRNRAFREIHHVIFRSEGGTHDPETLGELCSAHHLAVHRGAIRIEGTYSEGFRVVHRDGRPYGTEPLATEAPTWAPSAEPPEPPREAPCRESDLHADALHADALSALRNLGFKDREARRALASADGQTLETILRHALASLTKGSRTEAARGSRAREPGPAWRGVWRQGGRSLTRDEGAAASP